MESLDLAPVEKKNTELETIVMSLVVCDKASHDQACLLEKDVQAQIKSIEKLLEEPKAKMNESVNALRAMEKSLMSPLTAAKAALKIKIGGWRVVEKVRQDEERRLAQAAAQRAIDEARLAHAQALQDSGQTGAAMATLSRPMVAVSVPPVQKIEAKGVAIRETWRAECENLQELIAWVAEDLPRRSGYLLANTSALSAEAKTSKELFKIPGCIATKTFS